MAKKATVSNTKAKSMTKSAIFQELATKTNLNKKQIGEVFDALIDLIKKQLAKKGPYHGRSPQTRSPILLLASLNCGDVSSTQALWRTSRRPGSALSRYFPTRKQLFPTSWRHICPFVSSSSNASSRTIVI